MTIFFILRAFLERVQKFFLPPAEGIFKHALILWYLLHSPGSGFLSFFLLLRRTAKDHCAKGRKLKCDGVLSLISLLFL